MFKPILIGLCLICLLFLVLYNLDSGVDYYFTYEPQTRLWLEGRTILYDNLSRGLYNPPWLIWLLSGFAIWPYQIGLTLLRVVTFLVIIYSLLTFTALKSGWKPLFAFVLGLVNLHTFDLIYRGQIDGFALLGLVLTLRYPQWFVQGLGFSLMLIKPPNSLPLLLFLLLEKWQLEKKQALKALIVPGIIFLISLGWHGLWPLRLLESFQLKPPFDEWKTTIWRAAEVWHLSIVVPIIVALSVLIIAVGLWKYTESNHQRLVLILVTTFVITPYALSYHYVLLLAIVFPLLCCWKLSVGLFLYSLTYLPLLRFFINAEHSYIDLIFVITMFISVAFWLRTKKPSLGGPLADKEPPSNLVQASNLTNLTDTVSRPISSTT